jgi:cellulose synthase (UDP-forming)
MMLVLIAALGSLLYGSFLFNPANRGDFLPYVFVIVAESFLLGQALLSLWTILASGHSPRNFGFHRAQDTLLGTRTHLVGKYQATPLTLHIGKKAILVDIFITTYGEDIELIRKTVIAANAILGRHTTSILDDGKSDTVMRLAAELDVGYIRRHGNEGAKAGNINNALRYTRGELFVIFDADFVPDPDFLYETVPFFENENIAFVQTPQHYDNLDTLISKGAGYMQYVFYSLIQPGKNRFNAAFCVGTNVVFRRSAIESIGGIYQASKSEDIWTSILLHEKGYQSVYIPNVLALGKTPDTIMAYTKQQLRWATGAFEIFFRHNPLRRKVNLTVDQKLQYFGTSAHYFNGLASLLLVLLPPLQIFFNLTPVNLHIPFITWALYYSGFYVMQILVAFYTMGGFRLQTLMLANASFPIYNRALFNALFHKEQAWHVTGRVGKIDSPFNYIIPQVLFFIFLLGTTIVGVWKSNYTQHLSLSLFWNVVNTAVLGSFIWVAYRESRASKYLKKTQTEGGVDKTIRIKVQTA